MHDTFSPFYALSFHVTVLFNDYLIIIQFCHSNNLSNNNNMLSKQETFLFLLTHDTFN